MMSDREVADMLIALMEAEPEQWDRVGDRYTHLPTSLEVNKRCDTNVILNDKRRHGIRIFQFKWWQSRRLSKALDNLTRKLAVLRIDERKEDID